MNRPLPTAIEPKRDQLEHQIARAAESLEAQIDAREFHAIGLGGDALVLALALGHATQCEVFKQKYGTYMQEEAVRLLGELQ